MLLAEQRTGSTEFEWPTWLLIVGVYGAWVALTLFHQHLAWWLLLPLGAYTTCLYSHLQHEVIHGHPTRSQRLNDLLVTLPITLWIPYRIYKDSHIAHHRSTVLADPWDDPESFYVERSDWSALSPVMRALLTANNTFTGRLTIGPFLCLYGFWKQEAKALLRGERRYGLTWLAHAALVALVLTWVTQAAGMSVLKYTAFFVLPGLSLTLMRSYLEHRPGQNQVERTAIVEGSWITRLLFLNNNFHVIHHARPKLAWYKIPPLYRRARSVIARRNGGYVFSGYLEIARKYALSPKDSPLYPAEVISR